MPDTTAAKVYLVGAGPGDVRLLTLRAKELIERADVVVYDRLVAAPTLALIPQTAKVIDVGKEAGYHKVKQGAISRLLADEAVACPGGTVVRLKGGDPFVFGRGGEEIETLIEEGIDFEVVPGVTSAIAAPSYAGIPVTHRDCCSSVHVITAHKRGDMVGDGVDYAAIARAGGTLVFLMGVAEVPRIQRGLLDAGMSSDTPVALIESGTTARQRRIDATLGSMLERAESQSVGSPAIVLVGEVAGLHFEWRDKLPLFGKRVVVTRARAQASRLTQQLREWGAEVLEAPAFAIQALDSPAIESALRNLSSYRYVAFTSPNGVDALFVALQKHAIDVRALHACRIASIGPGTSEALAQRGLIADLQPDVYDAAHLGRAIAASCEAGDRVLALRAQEASPDLPAALKAAHVALDDVAVYRADMGVAHAELLRAWVSEGPVIAALGSARCAQAFADAIDGLDTSRVTAACIGRQTAEAAKNAGLTDIVVAKKATIDDLVAGIAGGR